MPDLEVQPFTETRIVDLRFPVPELRRQSALNLQVIQLQLNYASGFRKVSAHIPDADIKTGDFGARELCLDHHRSSRVLVEKLGVSSPVLPLRLVRQIPGTLPDSRIAAHLLLMLDPISPRVKDHNKGLG
jgi:hypothetical protein